MNWCFCILICCCILLAAVAVILVRALRQAKKEQSERSRSCEAAGASEEEQRLLAKIEEGFQNEEFKMYLQFIVDAKTERIVSAEALSRWETSEGKTVFPGEYIGLMESTGLITKLDYYMFEKACSRLSGWKGTEFEELTLSCNFTRITISGTEFVDRIEQISERYDFDRRKLLIEITEDSIEKNLDVAMKNILRVKELGFRIALDDIGSGYTSLMSLCEYPIDVVKIDREILLLANAERGRKLFCGIVSLAHYLNLKVVCEGVETEEQVQLVSESDCDYVQGWYYSKAHSEENAETFARAYMEKMEG